MHEVEPGRRVVLGWGWEGGGTPPVDGSTVIVTIEPDGAGSQVTLVHEGLTAEEEASHAEGWQHFLERLESAAAGDAGQDPWAWAPEDLTPTVAAEAVLAAIQPILRGLTPDDREKPTPCTEFTCHQVVEHLLGSLAGLGAMAGGTVTRPDDGGAENKVSVMAGQAIDAWRALDMDSEVDGPLGPMPARSAATLLPVELLLHGWDVAQAVGREIAISDEVVAYVHGLATPLLPKARGRSFADEVPAQEGASALDRLAAFAGRTAMLPVA